MSLHIRAWLALEAWLTGVRWSRRRPLLEAEAEARAWQQIRESVAEDREWAPARPAMPYMASVACVHVRWARWDGQAVRRACRALRLGADPRELAADLAAYVGVTS